MGRKQRRPQRAPGQGRGDSPRGKSLSDGRGSGMVLDRKTDQADLDRQPVNDVGDGIGRQRPNPSVVANGTQPPLGPGDDEPGEAIGQFRGQLTGNRSRPLGPCLLKIELDPLRTLAQDCTGRAPTRPRPTRQEGSSPPVR